MKHTKHDEIALALKRWHETISYFESVRDPALIDFAIYDMEAAKRKYIFLLKRAGRREISLEDKNGFTFQHFGVRSRTADTMDTV